MKEHDPNRKSNEPRSEPSRHEDPSRNDADRSRNMGNQGNPENPGSQPAPRRPGTDEDEDS